MATAITQRMDATVPLDDQEVLNMLGWSVKARKIGEVDNEVPGVERSEWRQAYWAKHETMTAFEVAGFRGRDPRCVAYARFATIRQAISWMDRWTKGYPESELPVPLKDPVEPEPARRPVKRIQVAVGDVFHDDPDEAGFYRFFQVTAVEKRKRLVTIREIKAAYGRDDGERLWAWPVAGKFVGRKEHTYALAWTDEDRGYNARREDFQSWPYLTVKRREYLALYLGHELRVWES